MSIVVHNHVNLVCAGGGFANTITSSALTQVRIQDYACSTAAKSAAGIGVSGDMADTPPLSGFFVSTAWQVCYGRVMWAVERLAGSISRYANPHDSLTLIGVGASGISTADMESLS
jgi:hypothetical protein